MPLREDAHLRPLHIPARMPCLFRQIRLRHAVELKHYLDVRELIEAEQCVGSETGSIKLDDGLDGVPVVVEAGGAGAADSGDYI